MKTLLKGIALACASLFLISVSSPAQEREAITEGTEYMVVFPQVTASASEKPLPQPMQLFIGSRFDTKVTITTPATINGNPPINRTYDVIKDEVLVVPISTNYMVNEPSMKDGLGISVIAEHPITVYTYQAWLGYDCYCVCIHIYGKRS